VEKRRCPSSGRRVAFEKIKEEEEEEEEKKGYIK
jgi:hypothetical protein